MGITQFQCPQKLKNFSYLVTCEQSKKCAVVDPSFCGKQLLETISTHDFDLQYILNTHDHHDHVHDNTLLKNNFHRAQIACHPKIQDRSITLEDEAELNLGQLKIKVIHTPGHTEGDLCFYVKNMLLTGDVLFVGKVGGTRTRESAFKQFHSLKKLTSLPDSTEVLPGHNNGPKPTSTIGIEKTYNPFLLRLENFEDFWWLKENWQAFKRSHGL